MMFLARQHTLKRIEFLMPDEIEYFYQAKEIKNSYLDLYLQRANLKIKSISFLSLVTFFIIVLSLLSLNYFSIYFIPVVVFGAIFLIYLLLESRIEKRSTDFSTDYPTILMATASSVKAGLTPYAALDRSVHLLPKESLVRLEVTNLLNKIRKGDCKKNALSEFGQTIRQPDLILFREAFLIVLEHGGRFAPTLERLANVCRDRSSLIRSAQVSTASMRMTANVLLIVAPIVVLLTAIRTKNYWTIFFTNPTANFIGSAGLIVILLSYGILVKMSSFKP